MTPTVTPQAKQQSAPAPRRISPECSEVLHMLSSLEAKPALAGKTVKG